jgi:hypothetical protein
VASSVLTKNKKDRGAWYLIFGRTVGKQSSKAAKQQSSKAAKQQSSKAAKQQSSKAAKQQSSKAAKQQSRGVKKKGCFYCLLTYLQVRSERVKQCSCVKKKSKTVNL